MMSTRVSRAALLASRVPMPGNPEWDEKHEKKLAETKRKREKRIAIEKATSSSKSKRNQPNPRQRSPNLLLNTPNSPSNELNTLSNPLRFIVHKSITFDKISLLKSAAILSDHFKFDEFNHQQARLADEFAIKNGCQLHLISYKAKASSQSKEDPIVTMIGGPEDWEEAVGIVQYLKDQGKKTLHMHIDIQYSRFPDVQIIDIDDNSNIHEEPTTKKDEMDEDIEELDLEEPIRLKRKARTTTTKLQEQAAEQLEVNIKKGKNVTNLQRLWKCQDKTCRNYDRWCYRNGIKDQDHHILLSSHLATWNQAITNKEATLKEPPDDLNLQVSSKILKKTTTAVMEERLTQEQEQNIAMLHAIHDIAAPKPPTVEPTPISGSMLPTHGITPGYSMPSMPVSPYNYNYSLPPPPGPPNLWGYHQYNPYYTMPPSPYGYPPVPPVPILAPPAPSAPLVEPSLPLPPPKAPKLEKQQRPSSSSASDEARSSPIRYTGDWGVILWEYIEWHRQKAPSEAANLLEYYTKLKVNGYSLEQIQGFNNKKWKRLNIPLGSGKRLRSQIKEFLQEMLRKSEKRPDNAALATLAEVCGQVTAREGYNSGIEEEEEEEEFY